MRIQRSSGQPAWRLTHPLRLWTILPLFSLAMLLGCGAKDPPATAPNAATNSPARAPAASIAGKAPLPATPDDPATGANLLLSAIDLRQQLLKGHAEVVDKFLVVQARQQPALVAIPTRLPARYELHCTLTRLEGDGPAFVGLVVEGQPCLLVVDGSPEEGSRTGISLIDGKPYQHADYPAAAHKGKLITNGQATQIRCRIDGQTLLVRVDEREVFRWQIDARRLSVKPFFQTPTPGQLTLGGAKSVIRFERLEVRAITATAGSADRVQGATKKQVQDKRGRNDHGPKVAKARDPAKKQVQNEPKEEVAKKNQATTEPAAPPPEPKLAATSPEDWAFALRRGDLTTPVPGEQTKLVMVGDKMVATAAAVEQPVQLLYRVPLSGDFSLAAQVDFPRYEKVGTAMAGVGRVGFRSTIAGVEQLWPLSFLASDPGSHRLVLTRVGKRLALQVDGTRLANSTVENTTPGYFVLQMSTPTEVGIEGIQVQGSGGGAKLVQGARSGTPTGLKLVRSVDKWGLRTTGDPRQDQFLYDDVKLTHDASGLQVSKSLASKEIQLVYLEDLADDCLVTLRIELPEPKSSGGRFAQTTLDVSPTQRPGLGIQLRVPRTSRVAEFQVQKSGQLVVARLAATQLAKAESQTVRFTSPMRISVRADQDATLRVVGPQIATFVDSPTRVVGADEPPETIKLPGTVDDTAIAAGGDVWLLHFRSLRKVGVLDVAQAKITRFLPLDDPRAVIAGGLDRLFVLSPTTAEVTRYRLADLQPEASRKLALSNIHSATMGFASRGPLLVGGERGVVLLDGETLRPLETRFARPVGSSMHVGGLTASADGSFFGINGRGAAALLGYTPGVPAISVQGGGRSILPSPLAGWMHGDLPRAPNLEPAAVDGAPVHLATLPATRDPFYLSLHTPSGRNLDDALAMLVSIHAGSQARPLVSWQGEGDATEPLAAGFQNAGSGKKMIARHKRFLFHPPGGVVLMVSNQGDRLLARRIDIKTLLDASAIREPLVTSLPSFTALAGEPYRYQLAGWSRDGELRTELQSGPVGMQVTEAGAVSWTPAADAAGKSESVLLRVQDGGGNEAFHSFTVRVRQPSGDTGPLATSPVPAADAPPSRIDLPAPFTRIVSCGGGRWLALYLKSLHKVAVIDLIEARIIGYVDAKTDEPLLAGTRDALYLVDAAANEVEQWGLPAVSQNWRHKISDEADPLMVVAGCDSDGPLLLVGRDGGPYFFDPATKKTARLTTGGTGGGPAPAQISALKASADGRTFAVMRPFMARTGSFLLTRNAVGAYDASRVTFNGNYALPNADGTRLYTRLGIYATSGLRQIEAQDTTRPQYVVPALQGPFYVRYRGREYGTTSQPPAGPTVKIFVEDQQRPLAGFSAEEVFEGEFFKSAGGASIDAGERIVALPYDGRLAVLPHTNNAVFVKRIDLDGLLKEAAVDYLLVVSRPPEVAQRGDTYQYAVDVRSSTEEIQRNLASGPTGAALTPDGVFTWQVPPYGDAERHAVIISLKGGNGREQFHTFQIEVPAKAAPPPAEPPAHLPAQPFRAWTERTSGRQVEAKLLGTEDGKVRLERKDGKRFALPIGRLSDEDQAFVRKAVGTP